MLKRSVIFALSLFLIGCSSSSGSVRAQRAFYKAYSKSISESKNVQYVTPSTYSEGEIHTLGANLTVTELVDESVGTTLIAAEAHRLLTMANKDKKLKRYLSPYPLTLDRVDMTIDFRTDDEKIPERPYLSKIELRRGIMYFSYKNESRFKQERLSPFK
ncbi:MAG: hypothetical protein MRY21_01600 [Simkaniaceae bacterium]|nr:hypothetical protein [Simkaniaceae bacterium]